MHCTLPYNSRQRNKLTISSTVSNEKIKCTAHCTNVTTTHYSTAHQHAKTSLVWSLLCWCSCVTTVTKLQVSITHLYPYYTCISSTGDHLLKLLQMAVPCQHVTQVICTSCANIASWDPWSQKNNKHVHIIWMTPIRNTCVTIRTKLSLVLPPADALKCHGVNYVYSKYTVNAEIFTGD